MKKVFKALMIITISMVLMGGCKMDKKKPHAIITLMDERVIKLELYPEIAPVSVANFIKIANSGYYEGVIFHRIIDNFMIQTGGFYLEGNTIYQKERLEPIYGEFSSNGWENDLQHELGVISMARTNVKDSATAQFFICTAKTESLDGEYAAFGQAVDEDSLNVIKDLGRVKTIAISASFTDFPEIPIIIKSVQIKYQK